VIDLRDTQLLKVSLLAVDRPLTVLLPATTFALVLDGRYDLTTLDVPDLSERFSLTLSGLTSRGIPKGVDALHQLHVHSRRIDLAPFVALRKLADLTCRGAAIGPHRLSAFERGRKSRPACKRRESIAETARRRGSTGAHQGAQRQVANGQHRQSIP